MIKGFKPESALLSSAILDFVDYRLHKILRRAVLAYAGKCTLSWDGEEIFDHGVVKAVSTS